MKTPTSSTLPSPVARARSTARGRCRGRRAMTYATGGAAMLGTAIAAALLEAVCLLRVSGCVVDAPSRSRASVRPDTQFGREGPGGPSRVGALALEGDGADG